MTSLTLGPWTFDHTDYDPDADVLYLSIGEPRDAVGEESPDGHIWRFDAETGDFCGVTLIGVLAMLNAGETTIRLPIPPSSAPVEVGSEKLEPFVCA